MAMTPKFHGAFSLLRIRKNRDVNELYFGDVRIFNRGVYSFWKIHVAIEILQHNFRNQGVSVLHIPYSNKSSSFVGLIENNKNT